MAQHIFSGSGAPAFTPSQIGQHYIDTTNKVSYISVGTTSSSDWETSDAVSAIAAHVLEADPHAQYALDTDLATVATSGDYNDLINKPTLATVATSGDYDDLINKPTIASEWGDITGTLSDQTDLQSALDAKQNEINAFTNAILTQKTVSGDIQGIPDWEVNSQGGLTQTMTQVTDNGNTKSINNYNANIKNEVESNTESYILHENNFNIDVADEGFNLGTSGRAALFVNNNLSAINAANIGETAFTSNSFTIGNGTDAITARGLSYSYGFGTIRNNVTVNGPIQGYGFQPTFETGSIVDDSNAYVNSFYDFINAPDTIFGYYSGVTISPTLGGIYTNRNFTGININPTIDDFQGNAGFTGFSLAGTLTTLGTNGYQGIIINTAIGTVGNATGLSINQTITSSVNYQALNVDVSNVTASGSKLAGNFNGNVNINGSLNFSGALSIGQLNAFYGDNPVDGGGNPLVIHGLTSGMTALNGVTTANADAIGVSTAMLIELEEDSLTTSGPFGLGFSAMALPCVVRTETNSYLDFMSGTVAAVNLDGTSTGGTIDTMKLMRSVAVPNGITTINKLRGFQFDLPFGDPGTVTHGFYTSANVHNYFRGNLVVGESTEVATNASVGLEISSNTKAFLNARMTTTERDALTAINGMQVYNSTTDKLQVYAAGSWVDLH